MSLRTEDRRTVAGLHASIWSGTGPTVVALAGLGGSSALWRPLAESQSDVYVVAPDLRGRGRSRHVVGEPGLRAHARDLARVQGNHLTVLFAPDVHEAITATKVLGEL